MKILKSEQGSEQWLIDRLCVITGTRLKAVMGTVKAQDTLINELIAEHLTDRPKEMYKSVTMQRGNDEEHFAIKQYEKQTGVKIESFGLCIHSEFEWLGLSPDGFTKNLLHGTEVKAPNTDTLVGYLRAGTIPKEYYWQVIQYFIVNEKLKTLDFLPYDPRVKLDKLQLVPISVTRKDLEDDINKAMERLLKFREKWISEQDRLTF